MTQGAGARSGDCLSGAVGSRRRGLVVAAVGAALLVAALLSGCGRVGSPIPPEEVGVAAKLERERQEEARQEQAGGVPKETGTGAPEPGEPGKPGGIEEVVLPPLRPVDTR